jgi:hypothetical protein
MIDHPIIFSAPMVQALLAGRKTMTRRILNLPKKTFSGGPIYERKDMGGWEPTTSGGGGCFTIGKNGERIPAPERIAIWHKTTGVCMETPIQPGDRLWVRENWRTFVSLDDVKPRDLWAPGCGRGGGVRFEADAGGLSITKDGEHFYGVRDTDAPFGKQRPSIFLPRWASRLTLIVQSVKVERLQDISEADADAEGFAGDFPHVLFPELFPDKAGALTIPECFGRLWNSINGPDAWAANPWVAAIGFRVIKANIDSPEART